MSADLGPAGGDAGSGGGAALLLHFSDVCVDVRWKELVCRTYRICFVMSYYVASVLCCSSARNTYDARTRACYWNVLVRFNIHLV